MDTAQKVEQWKKGKQDINKFLITVYEESPENMNMYTDCTQFFHSEMERH